METGDTSSVTTSCAFIRTLQGPGPAEGAGRARVRRHALLYFRVCSAGGGGGAPPPPQSPSVSPPFCLCTLDFIGICFKKKARTPSSSSSLWKPPPTTVCSPSVLPPASASASVHFLHVSRTQQRKTDQWSGGLSSRGHVWKCVCVGDESDMATIVCVCARFPWAE